MRVLRRLVEEDVLHHQAFERGERRGHVLRVRVGLRHVLALHVQRLEAAVERRLEHVGDAQARLRLEVDAPGLAEQLARHGVGDVAIAGQLVRERTHVAGALHVVLAAQRVDADAFAAEVAGGHREVGDADHHGAALAVLGDAEAVIDRAVAALGVQPRRAAHQGRRHAGDFGHRLGRVLRQRHELAPFLERAGLAALGDERLVDEAFGDHHVRERVDQRDVGARPQLAGGSRPATCGLRTRSIARGSATISFAPSRSRRFIREANTG